MNPSSRPLSPFFRALLPTAFALTLGGLCLAEARPAWSLGLSMGGGGYNSRLQPDSWAGKEPTHFTGYRIGLEAEKAWRGPYSLGLRANAGGDENSTLIPHSFSRQMGSALVFVKRSALAWGPFDWSGMAGVGYEDIVLKYDEDYEPGALPDPDPPADRHFHSPILALGWSQRAFAYVAGLTVNETVTVSLHSVAMHLDFMLSVGWRKK